MNKKIIKLKHPPRAVHITHLKRVSDRVDDLEVPKIKIVEPEEINDNRIKELEEAYQKKYEEMYQAALEEGKRLGFKMSQEQLSVQLNTIITELSSQREKLLKDAEAIVVKLAYAIAQKIIRDQITTNSDLILNTVREAIKRVVDKDTILIKVNPSDWAVVKKHKTVFSSISNGIKHLEIVADEQVGQGGCVIETNSGSIDARIETQLEEIEKALLKGLQSV